MYNKNKTTNIWRWIILCLLVVLVPFTVIVLLDTDGAYKNFFTSKLQSVTSSFNKQQQQVPSVNQQPKDTLVTNKIIPMHAWQHKGVQVIFVPTENLPIIDIDVSFDAGSARDNKLFGISNLTVGLLDQGTEKLPNNPGAIASIFEDNGAIFSAYASRDRAAINLRTLSNIQELDKVLDLFSDVIARPSFDNTAIERLKQQVKVNIEYNKQMPAVLAQDAFMQALYQDHPYAHNPIGTSETIDLITQENIVNFHKSYYVANNAAVTIVGGIHRDKAKEIAAQVIDKLKNNKDIAPIALAKNITEPVIKKIDKIGNQSEVIVGRLATKTADPDNYALSIANHTIGAGFTSRLFKTIRIKEGLSYSVHSNLAPMHANGIFLASLQTKTATTEKARALMQGILEKFAKEGPTEAELALSKKFLLGSQAYWFESNKDILSTVSKLNFSKLPFDYFDNYAEKISAVTAQDVKDAFTKHLGQKNIVQVILSENS